MIAKNESVVDDARKPISLARWAFPQVSVRTLPIQNELKALRPPCYNHGNMKDRTAPKSFLRKETVTTFVLHLPTPLRSDI